MTAPVALTLGDPAGIGGEIALKAWPRLRESVPFFLIGDLDHIRSLATPLGIPVAVIDNPAEAAQVMPRGLPLLPHPLPRPAVPGVPVPENASAVIEIIARAVRLVETGAAVALCTNPINKKTLKDGADFAFPGHTEFLAHLRGARTAVMMLACPELRVVPVTIHVPVAEVPRLLTPALLEETIRVTARALVSDFGIARPRIAVAGLNPHAGEGGTMGREEITIIEPLLDRLRRDGLDLRGPMSADTMFHKAARLRYDAAICMYHDQALIPLKTLDFDGGVNVTLGLDIVRTSPDHGTGYDIAGQNIANPDSLIAALRMAWELGNRRCDG